MFRVLTLESNICYVYIFSPCRILLALNLSINLKLCCKEHIVSKRSLKLPWELQIIILLLMILVRWTFYMAFVKHVVFSFYILGIICLSVLMWLYIFQKIDKIKEVLLYLLDSFSFSFLFQVNLIPLRHKCKYYRYDCDILKLYSK